MDYKYMHIYICNKCKRLNRLGLHPLVLSKAGPKALAIKAKNWSVVVLTIRFYCLQNRGSGASLMAKAAIKPHAPALYSLVVIQFNGSGCSKSDKNLQAGVALCARFFSRTPIFICRCRQCYYCWEDAT
ncbi:hypothetical protein CJ030_MR4G026699 [Morella rubra]|uniref:Uncharacterized protein n=1 Tax=Morella rubra TaxID=262757 RepID=A0A6A1VTP7_9ROSI|nr:hypothetical protein CJ030_MR4G026699 [Morella rubra]